MYVGAPTPPRGMPASSFFIGALSVGAVAVLVLDLRDLMIQNRSATTKRAKSTLSSSQMSG